MKYKVSSLLMYHIIKTDVPIIVSLNMSVLLHRKLIYSGTSLESSPVQGYRKRRILCEEYNPFICILYFDHAPLYNLVNKSN
jgi:CRISPR/Cas system-associated protein Csx1